jgi:protein SCO1/2
MNRRRLLATGIASAVSLVLAGCQKAPLQFKSTDITGATFARDFELTNHSGNTRRLADYNGKLAIVFFGFTHCPDVCPGTLIHMKEVMAKLGEQADDVQVLFITVDPERDTQEVLSQYVPAFDKRFVGLRGSIDQTKAVTREFKVFYAKVPGSTEGTYSVDHTAASYVFDRDGQVRLMLKPETPTDAIVSDLKALLG